MRVSDVILMLFIVAVLPFVGLYLGVDCGVRILLNPKPE